MPDFGIGASIGASVGASVGAGASVGLSGTSSLFSGTGSLNAGASANIGASVNIGGVNLSAGAGFGVGINTATPGLTFNAGMGANANFTAGITGGLGGVTGAFGIDLGAAIGGALGGAFGGGFSGGGGGGDGLSVTNPKTVGRGYSINQVDSTLVNEREPLLKFKWICDSLPYGFDPLYVESINLPITVFEKKTPVFGGGQYSQFAGFNMLNDFEITFYEDSQGNTTAWLLEWQKKIKDFGNGGYRLPKEYKKHMVFTLLDTKGKDVIKVTLKNTWPVSVSDINLDWVSSERIVISATFTLDNIKYEILQLGFTTDTACVG